MYFLEMFVSAQSETKAQRQLKLVSSTFVQRKMIIFPRKLWIDSKIFLAYFENFLKDAGIRVYSTHTEKKALFAVRYIQSFQKNFVPFLGGTQNHSLQKTSRVCEH